MLVTSGFHYNSWTGQFPRVVTEELFSEFVLFILNLNRREETGWFTRFPLSRSWCWEGDLFCAPIRK